MAIKDQPTDLGKVYEPVGGAPDDPTPYNVHPKQPFGASGGSPTDPTPYNIHPLAANLGWITAIIQFYWNGYIDSLPGGTYAGGALAVKDAFGVLQKSPADVAPSGGRLATTVAGGAELGSEVVISPQGSAASITVDGDTISFVDAANGTYAHQGTSGVLTTGKRYQVSYSIESISEGGLRFTDVGQALTNRTTIGPFTEEFVAAGTYCRLQAYPSETSAVIKNWSVKEVLPTWVDNDGLGNDLHPYEEVQVPGFGPVKNYLTLTARADTEVVSIGDKRQWGTFWFTCTTGGTTGSGDPAVGAIGDTEIADGATVKWTNSGHYKLERRFLNCPAVTNKALSDYPRPSVGSEIFAGFASGGTEQGTISNRTETTFDSTGAGGITFVYLTIGKKYRATFTFSADAGTPTVQTFGGAVFFVSGVEKEFIADKNSIYFRNSETATFTGTGSLVEITDGLGTVSEWDGVSAFRNNVSNIQIDSASDQAVTLTVTEQTSVRLAAAVDEHGEAVNLTGITEQYDSKYLTAVADNSAGVADAFVAVLGAAGNTNAHTANVLAQATTGTGTLRRSTTAVGEVALSTTALTRTKFEGFTADALDTVMITIPAGSIVDIQWANLTESSSTLPLMEANTTRGDNELDRAWPSSVTGSEGAISVSFIPMAAGQTATLFSNYTDADNYVEVHCDAGNLYFNKRVAGVDHPSSVAYSHAALTEATAQVYFDSTGSGIRYSEDGGAFSAYGTDANTDDAVLSITASIGHKNGLNQIYAYEPEAKIFKNKEDMEGDV